jgi:serine/threonine-protein kinase
LGGYGWSAVACFGVAILAAVALALGVGSTDVTPSAAPGNPTPGAQGGDGPGSVPGTPSPDTDTDTSPQAPASDSSTPTESSQAPSGDLGLGVPMTSPACDSTWVVFLGAATNPATYAADISTLLDTYPGAMYTLTQGGCSSMRQQLDDGTLIYTVWTGPYPDQAAACAARTQFGGGAYVKVMDDVTSPDLLWEC